MNRFKRLQDLRPYGFSIIKLYYQIIIIKLQDLQIHDLTILSILCYNFFIFCIKSELAFLEKKSSIYLKKLCLIK